MKTYKTILALIIIPFLCHSKNDYFIKEVNFLSDDINISGSLIRKKNIPLKAAVIFVHGSGKQTRNINLAKKFANNGIAAFVYDKRGVGQSKGEYESSRAVSEKNLNLLALDAANAINSLASYINDDIPIGITGISQAGWIIPLAAEKTNNIDFMVNWSGPVCKVSEEDIFSKYTKDKDKKVIPSFEEALESRASKYNWPFFMGKDTNPVDSLIKLKIPGLWVFGAQDGSIPTDLSIKNLKMMKNKGLEYDYILYSAYGHNNIPETFTSVTDWIFSLE